MTNYSLEVMDHIDPALVEEVELSGPRKQRRPRFRAAVIAACVCLALVGTAAAVQFISGNFRAIDFYEHKWYPPAPGKENAVGDWWSGYHLLGGEISFFPLSSFSQEIQERAVENSQMTEFRSFANFDDAVEYYGVKIPENVVLQDLRPVRCYTSWSSSLEGLTCVDFDERFQRINGFEGLQLRVRVIMLSELMKYTPDFEMWFAGGYPDCYSFEMEEFEQDGITAMISHAIYEGSGPAFYDTFYGKECYSAHLLVNGIYHEVTVICSDRPEEGRELLEKVLSGF